MAVCSKYEKIIKQLIAGEINPENEQALRKHIETCQECRQLVEAHFQLTAQSIHLREAAPEDFMKVRQNVIRTIRNRQAAPKITWYYTIADYIPSFFAKPAVIVPLATIMFIAGFFLHSVILPPASQPDSNLIQQLNYTAKRNTDLHQVENSPYIFSDVRISDVNGDQIALGFNVSTHLELTRSKNDPLVKEVIAQAVLNPASLGNRLKAISYSEEIMDPKVKEALIFILLNDDNLAIRVKAMTSLANYPFDKATQDALLKIIKGDDPTQLRLLAIDYLTNQKLNKQTLEDAIKNLDGSRDAFLRQKLYQQIRN